MNSELVKRIPDQFFEILKVSGRIFFGQDFEVSQLKILNIS